MIDTSVGPVGLAIYPGFIILATTAAHMLLPKNVRWQDRATFIWLTFNSLNHFVLKTSFIVMSTFGHTVNTSSGVFAAIWRTYAAADTRWGTADPTIVSIVLPTVLVVAPFAVLIVYQIVKQDPTRYYWIVILSVVELYGAWMVFCPEWLIGSPHLNTSNPSNFWVLFTNVPWVIVDVLLLYDSYVNIAGSLDSAQRDKLGKVE